MMRGIARGIVLVLAAALLPVVAGGTSADAVIQPCTVSYAAPTNVTIPPKGTDPSHSFIIIPFDVTDTRVVTDLALAIDIAHPSGGSLSLHLHGSRSVGLSAMQAHNVNQTSGVWNGRYLFDEETGAAPATGADPAPGTYKPASQEDRLEGAPAYPGTDTWNLWVLNYSDVPGTMRNMTLTLTYSTCDTDGDGVEDKVDNCPTAANPDQANIDDDSLGDACDLDVDGDALANTADGCPGVGSINPTGCPSASRRARLRWLDDKVRLQASVTSPVEACQSGARIKLWRVRPHRDTKLLAVDATASGRYRFKVPRRARYYVTVSPSYVPGQAECGKAVSRKVRVPGT